MILRFEDDRLLAVLETTSGEPARDLLEKRFGAGRLRCAPARMPETARHGDALAVVVAGSEACRTVCRALRIRQGPLPAGAYRIRRTTHDRGEALIVFGGDLFGMLAGLADVLSWCESVPPGMRYDGGERTETPAFPLRFFWTWDHSANWLLDDPGGRVFGSVGPYLKRPETFVEEYRRLVDWCVRMRVNGLVVWGFLRDSHGGEASAREIARYAADRGVALLPGVGVSWYGGVWYEGNHPCNLETRLDAHPECVMRGVDDEHDGRGRRPAPGARPTGLSPYLPENRAWMTECLEWLFDAFPLGGVNLENGDFAVDHHPRAVRERKRMGGDMPDFLKDQFVAYRTALDVCHRRAPEGWNMFATYCGFGTDATESDPDAAGDATAYIARPPSYLRDLPPSSMPQWTVTHMLRRKPVPLEDWLDSRRPGAVWDNPAWPRELDAPAPRSAAFMHQASQWAMWPGAPRRTGLALATVAELCLRSHETGLEGVGMHGEVAPRAIPACLNYLAFRHWSYSPESSFEEFADETLAPYVGGREAARAYVRATALREAGRFDEAHATANPFFREAMSAVRNAPPEERLRLHAASRFWMLLYEARVRGDGPDLPADIIF